MKKRAIIYIIIAGILWGTSGIFVHYLSPYGFTAYQMTAVRAIVSFLCIFVYALIKNKALLRVKPINILLFLGIGASLFFTASCYYLSMQLTSVSTAVVLMYTAPIYVMVFSVLFFKEKLTKLGLVSIACMLSGCCLVAGIIGGAEFDVIGILIGVISGIAYATYNILTKISMQRNLAPISVTLYSFLFMSIISLFVLEPTTMVINVSHAPAITIPLLLGLGICTFVIPYFLYTVAMKDLSAGTASALSVVEPMAATLFSVVIFREALNWFSIIGIVLILSAIFIIGKAEKD